MSAGTAAGRGGEAVRIRLLGGVGVVTEAGDPVDVGPAKCQALLAALAFAPGTAVPVWRLVELVWGEDPPRTAERTLQTYVTRLRKALGDAVVVRAGDAYRLDVRPESVDVVRFRRRFEAGDVAAALAEWTGPPLAGLVAPGLTAAADGLTERWLTALETDLAARVEGDPSGAVGTLTELVAAHPFREELWALLMTACYRTGRQADALAAYRTARQTLVDRLGVEPGPRLRELERLVLAHDERLAANGSPTRPQPVTDGGGGNLPVRLGRLIGRERELATIETALAEYPVVTLVGPGGIGKTRLALAAAGRFTADGGAWVVDLTEIASPADVPRAVAGILGVKETTDRPLSQAVVTALRPRRTLVVLDNCEHVVDGAARLALAIAEGCPHAHVLATSREPLGVAHGHERLVAVAPLDPAGPAAELFEERAVAVCGTFDPAAARCDVEEICRRLDGVPLAIELAAARTTTLTTADLLARLDDQLRLLVGGPRTDAERHRTLRATIQWSSDLLAPAQRLLFRRLSVFAGGFDLPAAEAVAEGGAIEAADVARLLGDLVQRSIVGAEQGRFGRRFRLLEPVRQFAAEQLAQTGDAEPVARRHARWCLDRVADVGRCLAGPAEAEGAARLDEHWPNLRAAFDRACAAGDRRLAHELVRPIATEIPLRNRAEIGDWAERILAMTPPDDAELISFGLAWAAQRYKLTVNPGGYERLVVRYGEPDDPLVRHARAAALGDQAALAEFSPPAAAELRRRGVPLLAAQVDVDAGAARLFTGRFAEHDALITELADRFRAEGPPTLLNWCLMLLGYSAAFQGRDADAERWFEAAVDVEVPPRTHSPNRPVEARVLFRRGDRRRALRILAAHLAELHETGNVQLACVAAVEFVTMTARLGRRHDAARALRYLETTGLFDVPVWRDQVAAASRLVVEGLGLAAVAAEPVRDDREALEFMRRTLAELAAAPPDGPL